MMRLLRMPIRSATIVVRVLLMQLFGFCATDAAITNMYIADADASAVDVVAAADLCAADSKHLLD